MQRCRWNIGLWVALGLVMISTPAWAETRYVLEDVPELAKALQQMRAAQPTVGRGGPTAAKFRDAAVMLVAADLARKDGKLDDAKKLAAYCVSTLEGGSGTPTLVDLKKDAKLSKHVGTADGKVPGGEGKVLTEGDFTKDLQQK